MASPIDPVQVYEEVEISRLPRFYTSTRLAAGFSPRENKDHLHRRPVHNRFRLISTSIEKLRRANLDDVKSGLSPDVTLHVASLIHTLENG